MSTLKNLRASLCHVPFFFVPLLHCAVCQEDHGYIIGLLVLLKVSKIQNEFIASSFLPKYEPNIVSCPALCHTTGQKFLQFLVHILEKNDDFINSFWNLLTFSLSGLSTKKLQTQYCPVRFTWHRGSIMLPCQQKTNKPKKSYIYPKSYKNSNEFCTFLFLRRIENFCNFAKVSYVWGWFFFIFLWAQQIQIYSCQSIVYSTYLGCITLK